MPILGNKQHGFTLIELLIVLLIVGVITSAAVYSVKLVNRQNQNSLINQLKNQIQTVRHKAQMYNFSMRMRVVENQDDDDQSIITEYFDVAKQIWRTDAKTKKITLSNEETVLVDQPFIEMRANGFVTDGKICINDECWQHEEK